MDQSLKISNRLDVIHEELIDIAKKERELLIEQKRLLCEKNQACSIMDLIDNINMGSG